MKITLGYWGIKGRAQAARYLLAYTGAQFQEKIYRDAQSWFQKDKLSLGFNFPNLPYLIEGDFKLTESHAIYGYIINRSDKKQLYGKNYKDQALVENIQMFWEDLIGSLVKFCFNPEWEKDLKATQQKIAIGLDYLKNIIGEKEWMMGYITLADFLVIDFHPYAQKIAPEVLQKHQWLSKLRKSVQQLPQIQKYYEKQNSAKSDWPSLPPYAHFKI